MRKRTLGAVLLAGLALSGAGAFTNSNTVDASTAGVGSATVSGVTVNDIDYTVTQSVAGVDQISTVTFTATTSMANQKVILRLTGASGVLKTADNISSTNVCAVVTTTATCSFLVADRANVVDVTGVTIVAYDND